MDQDDKDTIRYHVQRLYGIAVQHPGKAEQAAATSALGELAKIIGWNERPARKAAYIPSSLPPAGFGDD